MNKPRLAQILTWTIGLLLLGGVALSFVARSFRFVDQSETWRPIRDAPTGKTMSGTFPISATRFRYASSSVGMGGRFTAFAVDGALTELLVFARRECAAFRGVVETREENEAGFPFSEESIHFWEKAYGVKLDWLRGLEASRGMLLQGEQGRGGCQNPRIFIDPEKGLLYLVATD